MKFLKLLILSLIIGTSLSADMATATANFISKLQKDGIGEVKLQPIVVERTWAKCAGCHGESGQDQAHGSHTIIQNMSSEDIEKALVGYSNGSYGGVLKDLMRAQVMDINKEDLKLLAQYIKTLEDKASKEKSGH